ncbi:MAG: hypothetical protein A2252_04135 [Elusimicrobia bacterium RIFOXYA2_FULL_39_19]|nr:MAG: hypothetical protein A2252_04135 [Elusimicrobia bacterium RIFOXYA2_FULL_39_19]
MQEDIKLLEAFKQGDMQAFETLVIKYKTPVFKAIYTIVGNVQEADDIAQEVFIKVFNNAGSFKFQSSFYTWLYRITYNECFDYMKKHKKKFVSLESELNDEELTSLLDILKDDSVSIENQLISTELQGLVIKELNSLPEKYAKVLTLIELQQLSYKETAELMNISVNKLKVWMFRARTKLKNKLEPLYNKYYHSEVTANEM